MFWSQSNLMIMIRIRMLFWGMTLTMLVVVKMKWVS